MSAGLDLIRTIGPEFSAVADATVEMFLEMSAQQSSASAWGAVFLQAMCFLTMHTMSQFGHGTDNPHAGTGSVAGGVSAVKVGDVSVGFGANAAASKADVSDADLMETAYGRRYLSLRGTRAATAPGVVQVDA